MCGDPGEAGDPSGAGEGGVDGEGDEEPTQAYSLGSPHSDQSDDEGAPMDCEPTVAYGES